MNTGKIYKTKQKEFILQCIKDCGDSYVTIHELSDRLETAGHKVGLTTIYRHLARLLEDNLIAKVSIDGVAGSCYKYVKNSEDGFFMKCEKCGDMVNIHCPELEKLYYHISSEHDIAINPGKTMFYGACNNCVKGN